MAMLYKGRSNGSFSINHEETDEVRFFDLRELRLKVASREIVLAGGSRTSLEKAGIL